MEGVTRLFLLIIASPSSLPPFISITFSSKPAQLAKETAWLDLSNSSSACRRAFEIPAQHRRIYSVEGGVFVLSAKTIKHFSEESVQIPRTFLGAGLESDVKNESWSECCGSQSVMSAPPFCLKATLI